MVLPNLYVRGIARISEREKDQTQEIQITQYKQHTGSLITT